MKRPHLLISNTPDDCTRDLSVLRESFLKREPTALLKAVLDSALSYLDAPLITPASELPNRASTHVRHANRDYFVVAAAGHRVSTCALAGLITQDQRYVDAAMAQVNCLFDPVIWPSWCDKAHPWHPADLRTGLLAYDLGLAYDWLHAMLTPEQRHTFVQGLDQRAIQPYFQSIANGATWAKPDRQDNWVTCIVGGLGILGMALANDHPESERLVELAAECMTRYMSIYGEQGEFNESPAYAASSRIVVGFFMLLQCHEPAFQSANAAVWDILAKHCYWQMYLTIPPGRIVCFGDAHYRSKPAADLFAACAAATRDPILQWFFLNHFQLDGSDHLRPELLLWFDPTLKQLAPQGQLSLGKHFPTYGGNVSSRSDWDPKAAACVVTGKAGQNREKHGHHDVGQLCIDAQGRPLIVDLGSPQLYPADYFGEQGRNYYNAAEHGHNLLSIDQQPRLPDRQLAAHFLSTEFDDTVSQWSIDLTALHDHVKHVRREVMHLLPGVIAVLDQAQCDDDQTHRFDLRWHTFDAARIEQDGSFVVTNGPARLLCRVVKLGEAGASPLIHTNGHHAYAPPFDRNRLGDLLPQKREPFVQSTTTQSGQVAFLSLFAVVSMGETYNPWKTTGTDAWQVEVGQIIHPICTYNQGGFWRFVRK